MYLLDWSKKTRFKSGSPPPWGVPKDSDPGIQYSPDGRMGIGGFVPQGVWICPQGAWIAPQGERIGHQDARIAPQGAWIAPSKCLIGRGGPVRLSWRIFIGTFKWRNISHTMNALFDFISALGYRNFHTILIKTSFCYFDLKILMIT